MADTKWTKEQESAIYTRDCNLLVAAAAGAGKTAVLVQRIIERIIDEKNPTDIDKLLVVTFTNAAASEMKERIGDGISAALDKNPDSKILQRQLTLLNRSNITTIHSFCLNVIRSNFHLIDIDPSFRVGDETETTLLKGEILEELFDDMYEKSEEDKKDFLDLVQSYGGRDDKKLLNIVEELYKFSQSLPWPEKWLYENSEAFNVGEDFDFNNTLWAKTLIKDIKLEILGLKNKALRGIDIASSHEGISQYIEIFQSDLSMIEDALYRDNWHEIKDIFLSMNFKALPRKKVPEELAELKEKIQSIRKNIKDRLTKTRDEVFLGSNNVGENLKNLYPRIKCLTYLVNEFSRRYQERKKERNIVDFNDIEHYALEILTDYDEDGSPKPSSVAIEYRKKFDEVLVDEYQDSNLVQEVILRGVARDTIPNMFMVGDVKQSIYRFRQAKPELFLNKYNTYSLEEGEENRKIKLFKNFRSREEVINGANYIFTQIMSENIGELEYDENEKLNLGADYPKPKESINYAGPIEIHLMEKSGTTSEVEEESGMIYEEEEEIPDNIQLEAKIVGKRIKEIMNEENPYMVLDKGSKEYRRVQFRDIVILMRATYEMAPIFMEELNNMDIPVFADTSSGYFETTEIRTILSLLQIIDNPRQDIPLLAVLRSPIFSFTPEDIMEIRLSNKDVSIYEALKITTGDEALRQRINEFLNKLEIWREKALHMSIDQFIWYLYTDTGYYGYAGAMPGGLQRQGNLRVLFERARAYEKTSYRGLFNFISFINKLRNSSGDMGSAKILGENENVVRIMSIHKSKGLEFPVVILSGIGKNFNLQDMRKNILFHHTLGFGPDYVDLEKRITYPTILKEIIKRKIKLETLSEEMRVLYVAFTRAKEKLIITGMGKKIDDSMEKWERILEDDEEKMPEYATFEGKSYMDWIMPPILKGDSSNWQLKIWKREELVEGKSEEKEDRDILKELETLRAHKDDIYLHKINERLNWEYKYGEAANIPAKFSISELKRRFSEVEDENSEKVVGDLILKKPLFTQEYKKFTSSEIGTLIHLVMEHIDINKTNTIEEIKEEIKAMVVNEFITEEELKAINPFKILKFFKGDLGERIKKSVDVKKETSFYVRVNSSDLYNNLPKDIYDEEKIILQGIIDLYFEEEGEIVLVDYKTDYIVDEEEIKKKYKIQLKYYKEALEKITGKKVKESYLYLFHLDKGVII
ncbi:helicase-exonuclease AddAB subunit AddA [Clostridium malenominatum]|uniref:ATP-dependent helicase/nuclease subunit A n=1 Tax=Clostridium malenominatum TaxID=1539 RepID=A0ABN1J758_9CLOT